VVLVALRWPSVRDTPRQTRRHARRAACSVRRPCRARTDNLCAGERSELCQQLQRPISCARCRPGMPVIGRATRPPPASNREPRGFRPRALPPRARKAWRDANAGCTVVAVQRPNPEPRRHRYHD